MQCRWLRATVICGNANIYLVWAVFVLCVLRREISSITIVESCVITYLNEHVPISVIVEDAGIHEFVFNDIPRPALALLNELLIRELTLRIFVEVLHVRVGRS